LGVDVAWTGGKPYDGSIVAPEQPMDVTDKARKVEDKCVQPLPEAKKLQ